MKIVKPRILSGFMELLPEDQLEFNKMYDTIRRVYEQFGFAPIETPAIELAEVLFAKGGGETEKQIYRFKKGDNDLALHFDLTVPLARYVAQHEHELVFPFRRYQMQKVWRGERAGAGRFREFYQCDIDVIGTNNVLVDAEIPSVIYEVFRQLGFEKFTIKINNRKILTGFYESLGLKDQAEAVLRVVDKIDKIGQQGVRKELLALDVVIDTIEALFVFIAIQGEIDEVLTRLGQLGIKNTIFQSGLTELGKVTNAMLMLGVPQKNFKIDLTVARGLDYYTGTVYETVLDEFPQVGSVCSGGRFDDLASYYTTTSLPGVGISIGLTRLFYMLREAGVVQSGARTPSRVIILPVDERAIERALAVAALLRGAGINTEINFEGGKLNKQFQYANKLKVPYVIVIGDDELKSMTLTMKDMATGKQSKLTTQQAIVKLLNPSDPDTKE